MLSSLKLAFTTTTFEKPNSGSRNNFTDKKPFLRIYNYIYEYLLV